MSVVLVTYNSGALLIECVQRVLASNCAVEIVVSDNASQDGSIEALLDLAEDEQRIQVLRGTSNLGFAAANNAALRLARGDMVLFLNPDCLIGNDTISRMEAVLRADPTAGMAGCMIRNCDGTVQESCLRPMPTPRRLARDLLGWANPPATSVEAISGAFMLIRRSDLDQIGSFDAGYFLHWEDLDLCRRFTEAGREILFVPDVEVTHFKGSSSSREPVAVDWNKHKGLMRYLRKFHFQGGAKALLAPVIALIALRFLLRTAKAKLTVAERSAAPEDAACSGRHEVWVFGATSMVGQFLLPKLVAAGCRVRAFCRDPDGSGIVGSPSLSVTRLDISAPDALPHLDQPQTVIWLAPIFLMHKRLPELLRLAPDRLIALSSTSVSTKTTSLNEGDQVLVRRLADAETDLRDLCERSGVRWAIFRPTMVYALGRDRNVTRLAALIRRFRVFPLAARGSGLRQPVHANDVAKACVNLLGTASAWDNTYVLGGGEILSYRDMIGRIFLHFRIHPRIVQCPPYLLRLIVPLFRLWRGYRDVSDAMILRVNQDMFFSNRDAEEAFGYRPRRFLEGDL